MILTLVTNSIIPVMILTRVKLLFNGNPSIRSFKKRYTGIMIPFVTRLKSAEKPGIRREIQVNSTIPFLTFITSYNFPRIFQ